MYIIMHGIPISDSAFWDLARDVRFRLGLCTVQWRCLRQTVAVACHRHGRHPSVFNASSSSCCLWPTSRPQLLAQPRPIDLSLVRSRGFYGAADTRSIFCTYSLSTISTVELSLHPIGIRPSLRKEKKKGPMLGWC